MSETQGVKASIADEVMVADEDEKKLTFSDQEDQSHTIVASPPGQAAAENADYVIRENILSSEKMENVYDTDKSSNIKINNVNDETTTDKQAEVIGKSISVTTNAKSPFAKFRELDRQNSLPTSSSTTKVPGKELMFKFTNDMAVQTNAVQIKERLLSWCRAKTKEYENVQIDNFSTSWNNGLAFCALLHHFKPDAFDYSTLKPENRRKNFQLAFEKADETAGIAPLLDVEDMVIMRKPDWKCVFTYVQSIYRRFKDED